MTPRAKRIMPLLKYASRKQEQAEQTLANSNQQLQDTRNKLQQMKQYREEYAKNMVSGKISASLLRDKQAFIQQLDQLISTLEQQLTLMSNQASNHQQAWLEARQHTDAFDLLIEKLESTDEQYRQQQEQNFIDDLPLKNQASLK